MPAIPGDDPDVTALKRAVRALHERGLTDDRITNYVRQALTEPRLRLPAVFRPTHDTGGLPGFRAIDCFADAGTPVMPPCAGTLVWPHRIPWDLSKRVGGLTCYWQADDHPVTYFLTHFGTLAERGHYRVTDVIGTVAPVPQRLWSPHIHEGRHAGVYVPAHP